MALLLRGFADANIFAQAVSIIAAATIGLALAPSSGRTDQCGDRPYDVVLHRANSQALTALRLSVATRGTAVRDAELRQLVEQDLQIILAIKPYLRPAVLAAYATASAEGQHVIESVVGETDPSFLTRLKDESP
jgi:pyrroline-5-carboxylate reductase